MNFNEKLQALRKQKGFTQQDLAEKLFVSRTAVSKWESGKGYPNIESLKQISKLFEITVDELLSTDEILNLAEQQNKQNQNNLRDLVFGLLDIGTALLLFFPLFAQNIGGTVSEVSLLNLTEISPFLRLGFLIFVFATIITGVLTLAFQSFENGFWAKIKPSLSIILNLLCVVLFTLCRQPYPALLLLMFLLIKTPLFTKKQ